MNRIKEILEKKGIKQTWLADRLEKSYNMVNSYVQNRRQPSLDDLYRIADILEVEAKELLSFSRSKREDQNLASNETVKIPLLGIVACGMPIFAEENIEAEIPVSVKLIKRSYKYFLLKAFGDSMNKKGINNGDIVLIRQQQVAENGDLILALIDNEATIKEYQNNGNTIVLKPNSTNPDHQPIILTSDFRIQGIVETVIQF